MNALIAARAVAGMGGGGSVHIWDLIISHFYCCSFQSNANVLVSWQVCISHKDLVYVLIEKKPGSVKHCRFWSCPSVRFHILPNPVITWSDKFSIGINVACIREWLTCKQRYLYIFFTPREPTPFRLFGLGSGLGGPLGGWVNDKFGWCVCWSRFRLR